MCSFTDASCATGRRYGAYAGALSHACVGAVDADLGAPDFAGDLAGVDLAGAPDAGGGCVTELRAGGVHTCAAGKGGALFCWGANANGQLGNGGAGDHSAVPVPVLDSAGAQLAGVTALGGGALHACAITGGSLLCWGDDRSAQLGDSGIGGRNPTPARVSLADPRAIGAGANHTCALDGSHVQWCWGANGSGQAGQPSTTNPVLLPATALNGPTAIASGGAHSCAVVMGGVWCWGLNTSRQLGVSGSTAAQIDSPTALDALPSPAVDLALGDAFSCARTMDGAVYCWGHNGDGQTGQSGAGDTPAPSVVRAAGNGVLSLAAGARHACAVKSDGAVVCWGANDRGQLGAPLGGAAAVAAGQTHSCARLRDGSVRCWGGNSSGQLGNGDTTDSATPVTAAVPCN